MGPKLKVVGDGPPYDEELRLWLESHIKEHSHLTTAVLSRREHIGMSRTALDGYLDGTYFLSKESGGLGTRKSRLEDLIRKYREKVEGSVRHGFSTTFVETRSWQQLQHACATAINENVIVVAYGKPGVGKSRALQEYCVRKMSTAPVVILCSANITVRYFLQKVAGELGLDDRPPIARLEDLVAEKLRRNPRPLFVDQANYLQEKSLGSICYLWELAKIPIILIGTKDLYELFNSSRLTEDVRAQLSSRVAMHYVLHELPLPQVRGIIQRALGKDATEEVVMQIHNLTGGIHRHVTNIIPRINEMKANKNIKAKLASGELKLKDVIDSAGLRLMTA